MAQYKIYGTNKPYTGKVVKIGQDLFTTEGGALEGNSYQVVLDAVNNNAPDLDGPDLTQGRGQDIITTFVVGDPTNFGKGSYFYEDGSRVLTGTKLHHHTIIPTGRQSNFMTQHVMNGNERDVFLNQPNPGERRMRTNPNRMNQQRTTTENMQNQGGGNTGGGGGGTY